MPLPPSDYASLIEPTWLPPRLFDPSSQGRLLAPPPAKGEVGRGSWPHPSIGTAYPYLPLEKGRGQSRWLTGYLAEWHHSNRPLGLDGQLQPIAFGIEEGALVIAIAGPAGAVQVFHLGALEQLEAGCHLVHRIHAAEGEGEVGQPLQRVRQMEIRREQDGAVHQLQAGAPFEAHEVRAELFARVVIALIGLPAKQGAVECLERLQILRPDGDVMDVHGWSPVTRCP